MHKMAYNVADNVTKGLKKLIPIWKNKSCDYCGKSLDEEDVVSIREYAKIYEKDPKHYIRHQQENNEIADPQYFFAPKVLQKMYVNKWEETNAVNRRDQNILNEFEERHEHIRKKCGHSDNFKIEHMITLQKSVGDDPGAEHRADAGISSREVPRTRTKLEKKYQIAIREKYLQKVELEARQYDKSKPEEKEKEFEALGKDEDFFFFIDLQRILKEQRDVLGLDEIKKRREDLKPPNCVGTIAKTVLTAGLGANRQRMYDEEMQRLNEAIEKKTEKLNGWIDTLYDESKRKELYKSVCQRIISNKKQKAAKGAINLSTGADSVQGSSSGETSVAANIIFQVKYLQPDDVQAGLGTVTGTSISVGSSEFTDKTDQPSWI